MEKTFSDLELVGAYVTPELFRDLERCIGVVWIGRRANKRTITYQTWNDRGRDIAAHFIEAEAPCFTLGILSFGTQGTQIIVSIPNHDTVEAGCSRSIGFVDDRANGDCDGALVAGELS